MNETRDSASKTLPLPPTPANSRSGQIRAFLLWQELAETTGQPNRWDPAPAGANHSSERLAGDAAVLMANANFVADRRAAIDEHASRALVTLPIVRASDKLQVSGALGDAPTDFLNRLCRNEC